MKAQALKSDFPLALLLASKLSCNPRVEATADTHQATKKTNKKRQPLLKVQTHNHFKAIETPVDA